MKKKISIVIIQSIMFILICSGMTVSAQWPMFHYNAGHLGVTSDEGSNAPHVLWSNETGGSIRWSSPAIQDNRLFIGSMDGNLYCYDAQTGEELWTFATEDSIWSSPAVSDGFVYVGSDDAKLYCIDVETGLKEWEFLTGGEVKSSPTIVDGKVYFGSKDAKVYCVNAVTGKPVWERPTEADWQQSSPAVVDNYVYIGSYRLDAETGEIKYSGTIGGSYWVKDASPTVVDDKVFVGSDSEKRLYCLWADNGTEVWNYPTTNNVLCTPAVTEELAYFGSFSKTFYALDKQTGVKQWEYPTSFVIYSSPAVTIEYVYFGCWDETSDNFFCLEAATGEEVWTYQLEGGLESSPAVVDDKVYVGSSDGIVYCFGNEAPSTPETPSGSQEGSIDQSIPFSIPAVTDPNGDTIQYQWEWGDGTTSSWTTSTQQSKSWSLAGTYQVRVKAKDNYDKETSWSPSFTITISPDGSEVHQLLIQTVTQVTEQTSFTITLVDAVTQEPVSDVSVSFNLMMETTNELGEVTFTAPDITASTSLEIIAAKTRYQTGRTSILVVAEEETPDDSAFVYGIVADHLGKRLEAVSICLFSESNPQMKTCVTTDSEGVYSTTIQPGSYMIEATKHGYEQQTQSVRLSQGEITQIDVILTPPTTDGDQPSEPVQNQLINLVVSTALETNNYGGEIVLTDNQKTIITYRDILIDVTDSSTEQVTITVSSEEEQPALFLVKLDETTLQDLTQVQVNYDGETLPMGDIETMLSFQAENPSYVIILSEDDQGDQLINVLVYVPHFSTHSITISSLIQGFFGITALLMYLGLTGVLLGLFFAPLAYKTMTLRKYQQNKKP